LSLASTYADNGAAAISVLTDVRFFQGSLQYLKGIRQLLDDRTVPLLRKDFLFDPYQVVEARAYGADALLLIVAALDDRDLKLLLEETQRWGMEALVEVHDAAELERALAVGASIIGINNRDLRSFHVDLETTRRLTEQLPTGARPIIVAESGIFGLEDLEKLRAWGADAILVGEALVTASDTAAKVRELSRTA
jgi:indole-3-glycerol phosphate synthase